LCKTRQAAKNCSIEQKSSSSQWTTKPNNLVNRLVQYFLSELPSAKAGVWRRHPQPLLTEAE
jgi:hypothetical protein